MNVHVWVRHRESGTHPQRGRRGDIVEILPIQKVLEAQTHRSVVPLVVDLNIPCGNNFQYVYVPEKKSYRKGWNCKTCPYDDPDLCDCRKYRRAMWDTGSLEEKPELISKSRFNINLDTVLPSDVKSYAFKVDNKVEQDKTDMLTWAKSNPKTRVIFQDKVTQ